MKIDLYEPIRVEIGYDYDIKSYQETNTAIVYLGGTEIYRQDVGYIPDSDYNYREEKIVEARDRALIPLALFLKEGIKGFLDES